MRIDHSELVLAIVDGAVHRYGELVQLFDSRVRQFVAQRVTDSATIEDLVQEIFYKAFKQIGKLNDPSRFEGWLLTISRRCVADHYRASFTKRSHNQCLDDSSLATESQIAASNWIWEEVDHLQREHREILRLRYRLSFTYDEIAEQTNLPHSTIRGRIYEARKALRRRLENKGLFP